jgi:radical SAM superfamily enzyme YgiQ (UPF0313 family)
VDSVIAELVQEKSRNPGLRMISIYDDSFPMSVPWLREFAEKYRNSINLPYWCFAYPTTLTREKIGLLVRSGCNNICIGCQSFSSRTLQLYKRNTDLARLQEVLAHLREYPVNVQIDLISFNPLESEEDKRTTFDFLLALEKNTPFNAQPHRQWHLSISRLVLFPHTEIYDGIPNRRKVTGEYAPEVLDPQAEVFWEMMYRLTFHDYLPQEELLALSWRRKAFLANYPECAVEDGIRWIARHLFQKGRFQMLEQIVAVADRMDPGLASDLQRLTLAQLRLAEEQASGGQAALAGARVN